MLKSILIAALIVGAYMSSILNETENNTLLSERKKIFSRIKSSFCRKKRSAPILYYSNHSARFQLLISGDVETNPGPTTCGICERQCEKILIKMNALNASPKLTVNVSPLNLPSTQTGCVHNVPTLFFLSSTVVISLKTP